MSKFKHVGGWLLSALMNKVVSIASEIHGRIMFGNAGYNNLRNLSKGFGDWKSDEEGENNER